MNKKQEFIKYVEALIENYPMNEEASIFWEALKTTTEEEKPAFTDNGKMILKHLQDNTETKTWLAKTIAEGLFISSRAVSGAMRKLVSDGYVEQISKSPSVYAITETGKNIVIE